MSKCKIILENPHDVYYAGSELGGKLECHLSEETTVRGIKVRLICKEQNKWHKRVRRKGKKRIKTFKGDHDILFMEQMLHGSDSGSFVVTRGTHVYNFTYVLPENTPSTFVGPYGSVTYKLVGVVDIPLGLDYEDTLPFKVESPIDLNTHPQDLQNPASYSDQKRSCCCRGGELTVNVDIPKRAYIPGEAIDCKIYVSNLSNTNVEAVRATFRRTTTYRVTSPYANAKHEEDIIQSVKEAGVGAHGEHTYNISLSILHDTYVPNFTQCRLFDVSYKLKVTCLMPTFHRNWSIRACDMEMGHVQWRNQRGTYPIGDGYPTAPILEGPAVYPGGRASAPPPQYPMGVVKGTGGQPSAPVDKDLPPSYDEAQQISNKLNKKH